MANEKPRILVVDDEVAMAMLLTEKLKDMGEGYVVETAYGCDEALEKIEQEEYTLVIADYKMPGMSGLDLIHALHRISPGTKVALMTAYASTEFRETVNYLALSGYLNGYLEKPFDMKQVREIIEDAVEDFGQGEEEPDRSGGRALAPSVRRHLREQMQKLLLDAEAQSVLLLNSSGYPIEAVGDTGAPVISDLSALVTENFSSSYHEGKNYNFYLHRLSSEFLLAVIFELSSQAGMVQFYTKQTAARLASLVGEKVSDES